jgi:hypothetical protein
MSHHGQHRLSSVVAGTTWLHHHQAKQHPQDEDPILHAVLDSIRIIARREQIGEENLYLFLTLLFSICPVFVCTSCYN